MLKELELVGFPIPPFLGEDSVTCLMIVYLKLPGFDVEVWGAATKLKLLKYPVLKVDAALDMYACFKWGGMKNSSLNFNYSFSLGAGCTSVFLCEFGL